MKNVFAILSLAFFCGCATITRYNDFKGVRIEENKQPIETVSISNTSWLLFKVIPLAGGNYNSPDGYGCKLFSDTAKLKNNLTMLDGEMAKVGATCVANLTSEEEQESIFFVLLTRHQFTTSAVLLKSKD